MFDQVVLGHVLHLALQVSPENYHSTTELPGDYHILIQLVLVQNKIITGTDHPKLQWCNSENSV